MRSILLALAAFALCAAAEAQPAQGPGPLPRTPPNPLAINWDRAAENIATCEESPA
jgi:hypothetical protein